jgi:hypothetical protein
MKQNEVQAATDIQENNNEYYYTNGRNGEKNETPHLNYTKTTN